MIITTTVQHTYALASPVEDGINADTIVVDVTDVITAVDNTAIK